MAINSRIRRRHRLSWQAISTFQGSVTASHFPTCNRSGIEVFMSSPQHSSLTELLENLHLESSQPPEGRFAWLHKRSQHTQHPLVQFTISKTHCTLHTVPKSRRKVAPHNRKTANRDITATICSSSDEREHPKEYVFVELDWKDVLGAHLQTADGQPLSRHAVVRRRVYMLALYACPPEKVTSDQHKESAPIKRHSREWTFRFFGDEIERVTQLHHALNKFADPQRAIMEDFERLSFMSPSENLSGSLRKFRVLIDPIGESGCSLHTYNQVVAPMFRVANVETTVEIAVDAHHVREIALQLPLNHFECVVVAGGDSCLHEFIQGLMARRDWQQAIRQPLGILPIDSGSSNGLAASIAHQSHEYLDLEAATFALIKGRPHDLDLTSVSNGIETRFSFLKLEWTVSGEGQPVAPVHLASRVLVDLHLSKSMRKQVTRTPVFSGRIWYLRQDVDTPQPVKYFHEHEFNGENIDRPGQELFSTELERGKWEELQGPFRSAWINNVSHATPSAFVAPGAQLDDGYTYITVVDGTQPKSEVWRMLFSLETGKHLKRSAVQQIGTRALKLQPEHTSDRLCVDGYPMSGPSLVAQVHRGLARIIVLPRR